MKHLCRTALAIFFVCCCILSPFTCLAETKLHAPHRTPLFPYDLDSYTTAFEACNAAVFYVIDARYQMSISYHLCNADADYKKQREKEYRNDAYNAFKAIVNKPTTELEEKLDKLEFRETPLYFGQYEPSSYATNTLLSVITDPQTDEKLWGELVWNLPDGTTKETNIFWKAKHPANFIYDPRSKHYFVTIDFLFYEGLFTNIWWINEDFKVEESCILPFTPKNKLDKLTISFAQSYHEGLQSTRPDVYLLGACRDVNNYAPDTNDGLCMSSCLDTTTDPKIKRILTGHAKDLSISPDGCRVAGTWLPHTDAVDIDKQYFVAEICPSEK